MSIIWCAEIGSCHQGSKSLAYELIRQAKWAGATIAKFQLGWTKEAQAKYCSSYDERRYIDDWAEDLAKWCNDLDIEFMASIWSMEGLEVARKVGMKRYKIAHQMRDYELLAEVDKDEKEVFVSGVGVSPNKRWKTIWVNRDYPTIDPSVPVLFEEEVDGENRAAWIYGYSSHTLGLADALLAVSRGAKFIEKHIVIERYDGFPKDASFALVPSEFKQMVEIGEEIARLR